jgi:hypothetical protein
MQQHHLKSLLSQVLKGYSVEIGEKIGKCYIRHIDNAVAAELEDFNIGLTERAQKEGLPTEAERLKELSIEGEWTEKEDDRIVELMGYIRNLRVSRSKLTVQSDKENLTKMIDDSNAEIKKLNDKKLELLGLTAESFSSRKLNEHYLYLCAYKNESLTEKLFSEDEFEDVAPIELRDLVSVYERFSERMNSTNLKRIAISNNFLNFFYLCDDNAHTFFGNPVAKLTFYQVELFGYARYFKRILSEMHDIVSQDYLDNPDKLIEEYDCYKAVQENLGDRINEQGVTSFVGAKKSDLKAMNIDAVGRVVDLAAEAAKRGGSLTMEEMIALEMGDIN